MRAIVGLGNLDPPPHGSAVTVGTFDGVHLGHRRLIATTLEIARREGLEATVLTWDRHPMETLRPTAAPPALTLAERRFELIEATGVDRLVVLPFDSEFSQWPPDRFVTDVLVRGLRARVVVVGTGWRFGHRAAGTVADLEAMGDGLGFSVMEAPLLEIAGEPASSSRVRAAIVAGDVALAHTLLGRPFDMDGIVVRGEERGASLGYPTANLDVDRSIVRPANGVYAGRARAGSLWYPAAINVGVVPQFGGREGVTPTKLEAYLLDFEGDLYGHRLRLEFHDRLRDERTFDSVEALVEQIGRDVEATRAATC